MVSLPEADQLRNLMTLSDALGVEFVSKIFVTETCWLWTGPALPTGYGRTGVTGRGKYAHRVVYEAVKGRIPDGLTVDHLCGRPACVNPDHLEAVTLRENILRGTGPAARNARKTHCRNGHPLTGDNVKVYTKPNHSQPGRYCRMCQRMNEQRYAERRRR
jgi:hypothetical protein